MPGVDQLEFRIVPAALAVANDNLLVRVCLLRVFVQVLHVRVSRGTVEVEVILLDVLAMIAFAVGQPEHALLEDRVVAVPQRQRETQALPVVTDTGNAVLAPAVGARARLIVTEVIPGISVLAVVLADSAPLPLAQVRAPFFQARISRRASSRRFSSAVLAMIGPRYEVRAKKGIASSGGASPASIGCWAYAGSGLRYAYGRAAANAAVSRRRGRSTR